MVTGFFGRPGGHHDLVHVHGRASCWPLAQDDIGPRSGEGADMLGKLDVIADQETGSGGRRQVEGHEALARGEKRPLPVAAKLHLCGSGDPRRRSFVKDEPLPTADSPSGQPMAKGHGMVRARAATASAWSSPRPSGGFGCSPLSPSWPRSRAGTSLRPSARKINPCPGPHWPARPSRAARARRDILRRANGAGGARSASRCAAASRSGRRPPGSPDRRPR